MVEVIWVTFALVLEFVIEVEDVKTERSRGTINCGREPIFTEELDISGGGTGTVAVCHNEAVNTGQIEHHEVSKTGGNARIGDIRVPKPDNKAGGSEGSLVEELSIPYLGDISISNLE